MELLAFSAALVGFIHSLSPSHWLPVVMTAKSRKWPLRTAILGALTAAAGHILVSLALGLAAVWVGIAFFAAYHERIERLGGVFLVLFGVVYAFLAYHHHAGCHGHEHHGPPVKGAKAPFLLLFSVGFAPCVAALPVFLAAATHGTLTVIVSMASFIAGVLLALVGSTILVTQGLLKLDHPILEHYGDVITGAVVALMGIALLLLPEHHHDLNFQSAGLSPVHQDGIARIAS